MVFYAIIRGPLGIGKSTVSERLVRELHAEYISIDGILDEQGLWVSGELSEFLAANRVAAERAKPALTRGSSVIFDGNFYWQDQIEDLTRRLDFPHFVFTLQAPLSVCIERDRLRAAPHGSTATREVYAKATAFAYGIGVDANREFETVVRDVLHRLAPQWVPH